MDQIVVFGGSGTIDLLPGVIPLPLVILRPKAGEQKRSGGQKEQKSDVLSNHINYFQAAKIIVDPIKPITVCHFKDPQTASILMPLQYPHPANHHNVLPPECPLPDLNVLLPT
jgi:hypothetical protein